MHLDTVAMILSETNENALRSLPLGSAVWIASAPHMRSTLAAARTMDLQVTELFPNGTTPTEWLFNHLDSLDQHHNEYSQQPPYSELLVFGLSPSPDIDTLLSDLGFANSTPTEFGLSAKKPKPAAL